MASKYPTRLQYSQGDVAVMQHFWPALAQNSWLLTVNGASHNSFLHASWLVDKALDLLCKRGSISHQARTLQMVFLCLSVLLTCVKQLVSILNCDCLSLAYLWNELSAVILLCTIGEPHILSLNTQAV